MWTVCWSLGTRLGNTDITTVYRVSRGSLRCLWFHCQNISSASTSVSYLTASCSASLPVIDCFPFVVHAPALPAVFPAHWSASCIFSFSTIHWKSVIHRHFFPSWASVSCYETYFDASWTNVKWAPANSEHYCLKKMKKWVIHQQI